MMVRRQQAWQLCFLAAGLASAGQAAAQRGRSTAGPALVRKYADTDRGSLLLKEPAVHPELARLLGNELKHLLQNVDVTGSVDVVDGALAVSGNAPHKGTEEEGVVCVVTYDLSVHAAILSGGRITVYTRQKDYEFLPICIKDWITQVNSGHKDRVTQPKNVGMVIPR